MTSPISARTWEIHLSVTPRPSTLSANFLFYRQTFLF
jgi:hypothetical protein